MERRTMRGMKRLLAILLFSSICFSQDSVTFETGVLPAIGTVTIEEWESPEGKGKTIFVITMTGGRVKDMPVSAYATRETAMKAMSRMQKLSAAVKYDLIQLGYFQ